MSILRSLKEIEGYHVSATDGDVGNVVNFLFDDTHWTVRYLVVKTGGFFDDRLVLISPVAFREVGWSAKKFHVALTVNQVKNSPNIDADKPVSRQHEQDYVSFYGYPPYWENSALWSLGAYPGVLAAGVGQPDKIAQANNDIHLRSAAELRGYHIQGSDGSLGHVADFIADEETWKIRYLVVDTSNWWFGRKVLVAPGWASRVDWSERKVYVDLTRHAIETSPGWNADLPIDRAYEASLHDHHRYPTYWPSTEGSDIQYDPDNHELGTEIQRRVRR